MKKKEKKSSNINMAEQYRHAQAGTYLHKSRARRHQGLRIKNPNCKKKKTFSNESLIVCVFCVKVPAAVLGAFVCSGPPHDQRLLFGLVF